MMVIICNCNHDLAQIHVLYIDLEMFARTLFSLIFANSGPREFKLLANIENTCF